MKGKRPSQPNLPVKGMARAIIDDPQGQYTAAERARVEDALEHRPEELTRVIAEIHIGLPQ
jgi:hypothetical protein